MVFGLFRKTYPVLKPEMIEPVDKPLTTGDAKKAFKQFMKQIGYLDQDELQDHADYLSREIKEHETYLKERITEKKEEISEEEKRIKELQGSLKQCDDDDREEIEWEINDCRETVETLTEELNTAKTELEEFKKDKRSFLVEYVNSETQGKK